MMFRIADDCGSPPTPTAHARVDIDDVRRRCREGAETRAGESREKVERRATLVTADRRGVEAAVLCG